MWSNPQFPADLVTFTKDILNGKLHFLCRELADCNVKSDSYRKQLWHLTKGKKRSNAGSNCQEVFCKKGVLGNFARFTRKHQCLRLFFNKVAGLRDATLSKKSLSRSCFLVNFEKFLKKTPWDDCFCNAHLIGVVLVSLLLTLNIFYTLF